MKVLSLLQPWATLVVTGAKTIETRSWSTLHRGPLLIHASSGRKGRLISKEPPFNKHIRAFDDLPLGAIIGSVHLDDVVPVECLHLEAPQLAAFTLEEKAFGDYTRGRYAWLLSRAVCLREPIIIRGSLGLWTYLPA